MFAEDLQQSHYSNFDTIERTGSVLSLVGCVLIISTFLSSHSFRKPITRLMFFASFGNIGSNVATLMARSYVGVPNSAGCQFQGFLIQWCLPADAFWTLAMALNVYLTFFRKYDAKRLKRMEIPYLLVCYGAPFVIALTYIFIYNRKNGRMYGDALLWCWVSSGWDIWRIATFYGPVWVTIFITFFIYIRTGRQIYLKYKTLRSMNSQSREPEPLLITEPFSTKTTEVYVTSEIVSTSMGIGGDHRTSAAVGAPTTTYTVEISADPTSRQQVSHHDDDDDDLDDDDGDEIKPASTRDLTPTSPVCPSSQPPYSPTSLMTSMKGRTFTGPISPGSLRAITTSSKVRRNRRKLAVYEANNAAWSYTKCALLFFTALLITWIPSTANRVYSVVWRNQISLGLQYASALVLPLQGFWNALVYIFTTRRACKELVLTALDFISTEDSRIVKGDSTNWKVENRHHSWSSPSGRPGQQERNKNSYVIESAQPNGSNGKAGLGPPMEPYERI